MHKHKARTKLIWEDCCVKHGFGGFNMLDPKEGLNALLRF